MIANMLGNDVNVDSQSIEKRAMTRLELWNTPHIRRRNSEEFRGAMNAPNKDVTKRTCEQLWRGTADNRVSLSTCECLPCETDHPPEMIKVVMKNPPDAILDRKYKASGILNAIFR